MEQHQPLPDQPAPDQPLSDQRRFRRSIITFLVTGFAALLGVVISAAVLMAMNQRQTRLINHTFQVEREIATLRFAATRLVAANLRHTQELTIASEQPIEAARQQLDQSLKQLTALTRDNPRQQARMPLLGTTAVQIELQAGIPVRDGLIDDSYVFVRRPNDLIVHLTNVMQAEEEALLARRTQEQHAIERGLTIILGMTGLLLSVVGALTATSLTSYTRELNASRQALRRANTGLEAAVQERTGQLSRANSEIQRFAYIVSHDLRSPLVNVMGFTAEMESAIGTLDALLSQAPADHPWTVPGEAHTILRQDLPEAIHFIRSSTEKMDRLINAILGLSRLGRRELAPQWLDLNALVREAVDSLRISLDEAGGQVEIQGVLPQIYTDRIALEQMITNLIENAIKYSHKERAPRIRVSATSQGDRIALAIADNGRGIDARDHERVFELFRRSGAQDRSGEGIGLAHVRALAYRLEGTVSLDSALGTGSTFTLHLPRHFSGTQT
jgi:signal transduction histidine kinase